MFEALTGNLPYLDSNPVEVMIMHQSAPIPSLTDKSNECEFDERIELLVRVMLAKKPGDRHQKMDEVVHDLISIQAGRKPLFAKEHWQSTNKRQSYEAIESDSKRADSNGINDEFNNEGEELEEEYEEKIERVHRNKNGKSKRARLNLITYASLAITAILTVTAASAIVLKKLKEKKPVVSYASVRSFSHESTTADGSKVLVFDFPKEYSIGEISTTNYERKINAQGTVTLPSKEIFRFWANKACMKNPKLLEQFKSNEIGELDLSVLPGASDEHLAAIRHLSKLGKLNISHCTLSPSGIAALPRFKISLSMAPLSMIKPFQN
jgi:serine/threonine protein kinase